MDDPFHTVCDKARPVYCCLAGSLAGAALGYKAEVGLVDFTPKGSWLTILLEAAT